MCVEEEEEGGEREREREREREEKRRQRTPETTLAVTILPTVNHTTCNIAKYTAVYPLLVIYMTVCH